MPRKKQKPHRAVIRLLSPEQTEALNHLIVSLGEPRLQHMHPQRGLQGEVQVIAFATGVDGAEHLIRLDRVPSFKGLPFTLALLKVFPEFPICLDLTWKGWTPISHALKPDGSKGGELGTI
jgi:hypothetical protein